MRVSYPLVLALVLVLVGALWWFRTKEMDFLTPDGLRGPLPEYVTHSYDPNLQPSIPNPVSRSAVADPGSDPALRYAKETDLEFGDLKSAPGLSEYSEHSRKGAAYLARLAAGLETCGEFQRALLAWERILDSCQAGETERATAADAIVRIQPTLPRWNIDPAGDIPILLQLGTPRAASDELSKTAREVAEFLRKDSSDVVAIVPRITTSSIPNAPSRSPIAVYFTGPLGLRSAQSNVLSTNPPEDDPEALRRDLLETIYRLVQGYLATLEGFTIPPAPAHPEDPELDFKRQITRLHWKRFADSLARPLDPEPGEADAPVDSREPEVSDETAPAPDEPQQADGPIESP